MKTLLFVLIVLYCGWELMKPTQTAADGYVEGEDDDCQPPMFVLKGGTMKKFCHKILGCGYFLEVVGWSILGNPIEKCSFCGQLFVLYGSINSRRKAISASQAEEIASPFQ